ncbi:MAG: hypothetical protein JRF51_17660, partial [Deltaproteobacteria bacterium]|nr:hypothetical protein [Deltaproteobacteria bacterium]
PLLLPIFHSPATFHLPLRLDELAANGFSGLLVSEVALGVVLQDTSIKAIIRVQMHTSNFLIVTLLSCTVLRCKADALIVSDLYDVALGSSAVFRNGML